VNVDALFNLTRQFLNMGVSEIEPESIIWNGNVFVGKSGRGSDRYGELTISNNVPYRMEISMAKGSPPYKAIKYTYPEPVALFAGFPSKMVISTIADSGLKPSDLKPVAELTFEYVQLATQRLSDDFFSNQQFIGPSVTHTNIYSNSVLYVQNLKSGKMVKAPPPFFGWRQHTNSNTRIAIYFCLALITVAPVVIIFVYWLNKTKQNKAQK
jgi:hypothetical protein